MSLLALLVLGASALGREDRPNIVWITFEDASPTLGCYGDSYASTPNLDALANRGLIYDLAFATTGVCATARSSLILGVYSSSVGTQHMRSEAALPDSVRPFPYYLRDAGYYCTNNVKTDYNFVAPSGTWDESSAQAHWRNGPDGKPFFSVFNFMITHESRIRGFPDATQSLGPDQRHDPSRANLPDYLPDTPETREDWARYHDLLSVLDKTHVARLLSQLEEDGLAENTIVFAFSDHGVGLPRAKQFIFDSGMQVPLIAYFPKKWQHLAPAEPGERIGDLVSFVDFGPTMLNLAGVSIPGHMQGRPFAGSAVSGRREYVYGTRDRMDERIDMSRTVRGERFKYHRNYMPYLPHYPWLDYMDRLDTAKEMRRLSRAGGLNEGLSYFMGPTKELEELYDLEEDPHELRNLAKDPRYAAALRQMREEHFRWVMRTRDTGFIPEQMLRDLSEGSSEYAYARSEDYELERCVATARLVEKGEAAVGDLRKALKDPYPPVRYWAAVGLTALGDRARLAVPELRSALQDDFVEVALAAAEALCYQGETGGALDLLEDTIVSGRPLERLAAANVLDRIDGIAKPILSAMKAEALGEGLGDLDLMTQWALARAIAELDNREAGLFPVGVASVEITPLEPVRLHAFPRGPRKNSVSEISQKLYAKALAIGSDEQGPALLITSDLLGVSDEMSEALFERLHSELGFADRSRLSLTATHNHSAPAIASVAPYVFREEPSERQAAEIRSYETFLMERLFEVARRALQGRRPSRLSFAKGSLDFAVHRRMVEEGKWVGFGENWEGPVDEDMPLLAVRSPTGDLRAIWTSFACHGVCWREPSVHGDWMGVAQERIESEYPGSVALVTIGCAGDINPINATGGDPISPGRAMSEEVFRLLGKPMRGLTAVTDAQLKRFDLPLQPTPKASFWKRRDDWYSRTALGALREGEALPNRLPYVVQSWSFGDDLAVLFLAGEVCVDYGLALKELFDGDRLWVNAYANAMPAYIPTSAMLDEGGWEVDASRYNYGVPSRLAPEAEGLLIQEASSLVPAAYRPDGREGEDDNPWWEKTGHPKGKWWTTYPGYEGEAADKIWQEVEIPPSPVRGPEEALETFQFAEDGFEIEIVAVEPLIVRPVHMQFDPRGRLWVVEMPGYMRDIDGSGEEDPSGRVVVLVDTDGDGRMDESTVFLDKLVMPRTVSLVEGGALVVEPPKVWFAEDLDGDLKADRKTLLVENYGVDGNPEHSANGLYRAIDNWLYSAKSDTRFRFDGGLLRAEPTAFRGQWGISQDDTGQLFYNYNASPLHTELVPAEYLIQENGVDLSRARNVVGQGLVNYNPVEDTTLHPARVTPLVTLGASDLRDDGTLKQFTAASSPHIYRGSQFPERYRGDAFVCDPVGNLVSRFRLRERSGSLKAERAYDGTEFLASTDERFRPVFLREGPDGALYLADMYTGIVEHKRYVTEYLRNQVLSRGMGRYTETGRIYRIVSTGRSRSTAETLEMRDNEKLVKALSSPNGWTRDTAQQLLVEGKRRGALGRLRRLAKSGESALGRLHALWTLEGLGEIDRATIADTMDDDDKRVRLAAIRLGERFLNQPDEAWIVKLYEKIRYESDEDLLLQLVLSAGRARSDWPLDLVAGLAAKSKDWRLPPAAAASLSGREMRFVSMIRRSDDWLAPSDVQRRLVKQLGRNLIQGRDSRRLEELLAVLNEMDGDWRCEALLEGMALAPAPEDRIKLENRPSILAKLTASEVERERSWGEALSKRVTWEGDQVEQESRGLAGQDAQAFKRGEALYQTICAACHQPSGDGMVGVAPPLAGSEWVVSDPRIPIQIALHGLAGQITVRGKDWNMAMAGFAANESVMDDQAIADIVTYIRNAWGNRGSPVDAAMVAEERKKSSKRGAPWTSSELESLYDTQKN